MIKSNKSVGTTIYIIVLLLAIGTVDVFQISNSDLEVLCFVELMDGETESEEKESNEKTEFNFFGFKISRNPITSAHSNRNDLSSFNISDYQLIDVITQPPEYLLL